MSVYDYVKALADQQNIPISEVEKQCGLGNATIKGWEKSMPKLDKIYPVAQFFKVDLEYFLTGHAKIVDPQLTVITHAFSVSDAEGKARIIQVAMNEMDRTEKEKTANASTSAV